MAAGSTAAAESIGVMTSDGSGLGEVARSVVSGGGVGEATATAARRRVERQRMPLARKVIVGTALLRGAESDYPVIGKLITEYSTKGSNW